jgi:hypothetical protein
MKRLHRTAVKRLYKRHKKESYCDCEYEHANILYPRIVEVQKMDCVGIVNPDGMSHSLSAGVDDDDVL